MLGMEFPDNATINVHRIGRVNSIHWTLYSLVDSTTSDPHEHLYDIEHELRAIGSHVLSDTSRLGIWIFSLFELEAQTEVEQVKTEQTTQSVISSRLKKISFGTLRVTEFAKESHNAAVSTPARNRAAAAAQEAIGMHGKPNSKSFGEVLPSIPVADPKGPGAPETTVDYDGVQPISDFLVFSKAKKALSISLITCLTKTSTWVPLGGVSCVRNVRTRALMRRENQNWPSFPPSEICLMSVVVEWTPTAEMFISSLYNIIPGLRRLSEVLLDQRQDAQSFQSRKVLVSPSGLVALHCGLATESEESADTNSEASPGQPTYRMRSPDDPLVEKKRSTVAYLAQRGIKLSGEDNWIRLQYRNSSSIHGVAEQDQDASRPSVTFLWPASLCFCIAKTFLHEERCSQRLVFGQESAMDPLHHAETWFMGKEGRNKAIEAQRKLEEAEAQKFNEAQNRTRKDSFTDLVPRPTQYGTTQDVASIYPTPPDGLPSQNSISMTQRPTPASYGEIVDRGQLDSVNTEAHLVGSPLASSLAPVISSTTYDQLEDDLYAEVDNDMFAANGLTEADLDFFDEPRADNSIVLPGDQEAHLGEASREKTEALGLRTNPNALDKVASKDTVDLITIDPRNELGKKILQKDVDPQQDSIPSDSPGDQDPMPNGSKVSLAQYLPKLTQEDSLAAEEILPNFGGLNQDTKYQHKLSYQSIHFKGKLDEFDRKYIRGRFGYQRGATPENAPTRVKLDPNDRSIPHVGLLLSSDQDSDTTEDESTTETSEAVDEDLVQEVMDDEVRLLSSLKRKRSPEEAIMSHINTPQRSIVSGAEKSVENLSDPTSSMFSWDSNNDFIGSLAVLLQKLKPETPKYHGNDREFMHVAQSVVEQISLGTNSFSEIARSLENPYCHPSRGEIRATVDPLRTVLQQFFPQSEHWNLQQLATVTREPWEPWEPLEGIVKDNVPSRPSQKEGILMPKPLSSPNPPTGCFFLSDPYARIRRNQKPIDILGSALHFWEELGLEPAHGAKNILALYIYPAIYSVREGLEAFATMIGNSYQNCKLGMHVSISNLIGYPNGLVPVFGGSGSIAEKAAQLNSLCEKLGQDLASLKAQQSNTVIYMINLFGSQTFIPYLCAAYLRLFKSYAALVELNKLDSPNDIVLQIIPGDLVASSNALTLPSPEAYRRLALEVYNRCGPDSHLDSEDRLRFPCAPSIQLARPIPKSISLKLSPEPAMGFLQADMFFHVAYSWHPGQQWLTASWTDNQGELQWNAPYCVSALGEEDPWPNMLAILTEIWDTTLELFDHSDSPWRLYIVKDSPMHEKELEAWLSLPAQGSQKVITTTILTVEAHPLLYFPTPDSQENFPLPSPNIYRSAGSTPAGQTISPEQSGLVSTPGGLPNPMTPASGVLEPEHDAKLIDITDESWGVVLPHPFPNNLLPSSWCRSAASGYLLKRAGTRDEDGLLPLAVDIIHMPNVKDGWLKELLGIYRDLAALARLRGTVHGLHGIMPWHIATARKANEGMNEMMSWDWR